MIGKDLKDEMIGWFWVIMTSIIIGILGWCLILYASKQLDGQPGTKSKTPSYEYPQAEGLL